MPAPDGAEDADGSASGRRSSDPNPDPLVDPRALQILSTEHWSLLSARSLAYNEAFSRAGMFLSFLSATLIVIGFLIAADSFSDAVLPVVALLLAVDLFIGLATAARLIGASREEFIALRGMNRIRHAYTELVPGIERYFVAPIHDDARGVLATFGEPLGPSAVRNVAHGITTAIGMLMLINVVIFAALVTVASIGLGASRPLGLVLGVLAFVVAFAGTAVLGMRQAMRTAAAADPMFPSPPPD
ncbi:MAG: hypothetical protein HYX57_04875 [Chloroflexi bacterium]|nr:hypothetical protein [Chloroflexota bacterium]